MMRSDAALAMQRKVLAVVVTYNPDANFAAHLAALTAQVDQVVVIDNGSVNVAAVQEAVQRTGCMFMTNRANLGVARALNQGLALARERGIAWLWTFDQDTEILSDAWPAIADVVQGLPMDRIALVGMSYRDRQTGRDYRAATAAIGEAAWIKVDSTITSGCLVNVAVAQQLGGFDERLFLDGVDIEFCIRCQRSDLNILKVTASVALHSLGHLKRHRVLGMTLHSTNHSALRRYYMARNTLRIVFRHGLTAPWQCLRLLLVLGATTFTVIVFEAHKRAKMAALLSGVVGFFRGEAGRASDMLIARLDRLE